VSGMRVARGDGDGGSGGSGGREGEEDEEQVSVAAAQLLESKALPLDCGLTPSARGDK